MKPWDAVSSKDPGDRPRRDTGLVGEMIRARPVMAACVKHTLFDVGGALVRARMWSRGPVLEAVDAGHVEPVDPSMGALSRDTHGFGHMGNRLTLRDPFNEQTTTMNSETGITVSHELLQPMVWWIVRDDKRVDVDPTGYYFTDAIIDERPRFSCSLRA